VPKKIWGLAKSLFFFFPAGMPNKLVVSEKRKNRKKKRISGIEKKD
jgi:hypothetical protein